MAGRFPMVAALVARLPWAGGFNPAWGWRSGESDFNLRDAAGFIEGWLRSPLNGQRFPRNEVRALNP